MYVREKQHRAQFRGRATELGRAPVRMLPEPAGMESFRAPRRLRELVPGERRPVQVLGQVRNEEEWIIPQLSPELAARLADQILARPRPRASGAALTPQATLFQHLIARLEAAKTGQLSGVVRIPPDLHRMTMIRSRFGRQLEVSDMEAVRRRRPFELQRAVQDPGGYIEFEDETMTEPLWETGPHWLAPIGASLPSHSTEGGSHLWPS